MVTKIHGDAAERSFVQHEHRELTPGLTKAYELAVGAGTLASPELARKLSTVLQWFDRTVRPHFAWEETWLYPELDRRSGDVWLTRLLAQAHAQVRTAADDVQFDHDRLILDGTHPRPAEIGGRVFALVALIRAHLELEERAIEPLLETDIVAD